VFREVENGDGVALSSGGEREVYVPLPVDHQPGWGFLWNLGVIASVGGSGGERKKRSVSPSIRGKGG